MTAENPLLECDVADLQKKPEKLLWGGLAFAILGVAFIFAVTVYLSHQGVFAKNSNSFKALLPFVLLFIPYHGLQLVWQFVVERRLLKRAKHSGLYLDSEGIGGPMLLLEGEFRDAMRKAKKPEFRILWQDINSFIVEPERRHKRTVAPPYYKVTFKGKSEKANDSFFIERKYFQDDEAHILQVVRDCLGEDNVVLNDEV